MKTLSLKLNDQIFLETEALIAITSMSWNKYVNEAIAQYNQFNRRELLGTQLKKESALVRENSLKILKDFDNI